jgi:NAD dependent epimerase/dehydratase family enzyme
MNVLVAGGTGDLGSVLHRPTIAPVPAFALKLLLGEMSEMMLTGQRVVPRAALER